MATPVAVGVDNGGTWIRFKGLNASGRCVWSLKKPSPSVDKLSAFLKKHLRKFQGLSRLAVGSRGVWKPSKRRAVKKALRGLAEQIIVMSDVEAAWMAAFVPHPSPLPHEGEGARRAGEGIIVISGTGSIAYGQKSDGTFARAGGFGPETGDEGSGYWIGKEWLKENPSTRMTTVREIASLAPGVIRKAQKGHPHALEVVRAAQSHLALLVMDLRRQLAYKGTIPISVSGSVLENAWFQRGFLKTLQMMSNKKYRFSRKKTDPAAALASGIMGHAHG